MNTFVAMVRFEAPEGLTKAELEVRLLGADLHEHSDAPRFLGQITKVVDVHCIKEG